MKKINEKLKKVKKILSKRKKILIIGGSLGIIAIGGNTAAIIVAIKEKSVKLKILADVEDWANADINDIEKSFENQSQIKAFSAKKINAIKAKKIFGSKEAKIYGITLPKDLKGTSLKYRAQPYEEDGEVKLELIITKKYGKDKTIVVTSTITGFKYFEKKIKEIIAINPTLEDASKDNEQIKRLLNDLKSAKIQAKDNIQMAENKNDFDKKFKTETSKVKALSNLITNHRKVIKTPNGTILGLDEDGTLKIEANNQKKGLNIASNAFAGKDETGKTSPKLVGFIIPEGVESIEKSAFWTAKQPPERFKFPNTLKYIGIRAFNQLESLPDGFTLPDGLTYIGAYAFKQLKYLPEGFTIPDGINKINVGTFYNLKSLPNGFTLPDGLTSIDKNSFYSIEKLPDGFTLPDTLKSIGDRAFFNIKELPKEFIFPNTISDIGDLAFSLLNIPKGTIATITIPEKFNKDSEKNRIFGKGTWENISFNSTYN